MRNDSRRVLTRVAFGILAILPSGASAHDFYLQPSAHSARSGERIAVAFRLFDAGAIEPVVRRNDRVLRFVCIDAAGERFVD